VRARTRERRKQGAESIRTHGESLPRVEPERAPFL
jgi:hypothetical protein